MFCQLPGNLTVRIIQITKGHRTAAGIHTSWIFATINPVDAHGAAFYCAYTTRYVAALVGQFFMYERPGFVGAGHHAVAAADTNMLINQDNAIFTFE